jgi:hypothetical protein
MPYTTINKSSSFMNSITYTANASNNAITGVGHQPDFLITKSRTSAYGANVYSSVSGVGKFFNGITTGVIGSSTDKIASFDTDGFTLKNGDNSNYNSGGTGVGWSWKAGTSFNNSAGANGATIASSGSVNTTSGISIIEYTGNGVTGATIAHGLGKIPTMMIVKNLNRTSEWTVYHKDIGNTHYLELNSTIPKADYDIWDDKTPTANVYYARSHERVNYNGDSYIAFFFTDIEGYSKIGSYIGNGNADGTFVYTGFKPKFVLIKQAVGNNATNWSITDDKRLGYNPDNRILYTNSSATEDSYDPIEHLSNGFKLISSTAGYNDGGDQYIYLAFGQSIVGTNNVPNNAR